MSDRARLAREKDRRHDRHADRRVKFAEKPFAGCDGEGGDVGGRHEYVLLRAGEHVLKTGKPLSSYECLDFLCALPDSHIWQAYFFDYDVTMILRDLPQDRWARLLDIDCRRIEGKPCSSWPVDWGRYQMDYLPRKEFRVRKKIWDAEKRRVGWTRWSIISDAGSFFQTSFVNALEQWFGSSEKRADGHNCSYCGNSGHEFIPESAEIGNAIRSIIEGKRERHEFAGLTKWMVEYNRLECVMLAELMERFREVAYRNVIRPRVWQGPGNLVSAVMKREGVPSNKDIEHMWVAHKELMRMANDGYYGGRFEACAIGDIPGPIYQYDINSAYANTYKDLPCLLHGNWERTDVMPDSGIYVGRVHFRNNAKLACCTLPIRDKKTGTLLFPQEGNGTYWSPELEVAKEYGRVDWFGGYRYVPRCGCQSFEWVYDLYAERKRLGKDQAGTVLKVVLASIYGKLAQSVGCAPYSNPIWASLIVSTVRGTLIRGALENGNARDVCMLATDGLFSREPRNLPLGTELGEWTETVHPSLFIVQSGVYFINGQKPKTRGTPMTKVMEHEQEFRDVWRRFLDGGELETVSIKLNNFIGARLANARGKMETAGQWVDVVKEIAFDWTSKRVAKGIEDTYVRTVPMRGSARLESAAYQRTIGGVRAIELLQFADQPEWGPQLL